MKKYSELYSRMSQQSKNLRWNDVELPDCLVSHNRVAFRTEVKHLECANPDSTQYSRVLTARICGSKCNCQSCTSTTVGGSESNFNSCTLATQIRVVEIRLCYSSSIEDAELLMHYFQYFMLAKEKHLQMRQQIRSIRSRPER